MKPSKILKVRKVLHTPENLQLMYESFKYKIQKKWQFGLIVKRVIGIALFNIENQWICATCFIHFILISWILM